LPRHDFGQPAADDGALLVGHDSQQQQRQSAADVGANVTGSNRRVTRSAAARLAADAGAGPSGLSMQEKRALAAQSSRAAVSAPAADVGAVFPDDSDEDVPLAVLERRQQNAIAFIAQNAPQDDETGPPLPVDQLAIIEDLIKRLHTMSVDEIKNGESNVYVSCNYIHIDLLNGRTGYFPLIVSSIFEQGEIFCEILITSVDCPVPFAQKTAVLLDEQLEIAVGRVRASYPGSNVIVVRDTGAENMATAKKFSSVVGANECLPSFTHVISGALSTLRKPGQVKNLQFRNAAGLLISVKADYIRKFVKLQTLPHHPIANRTKEGLYGMSQDMILKPDSSRWNMLLPNFQADLEVKLSDEERTHVDKLKLFTLTLLRILQYLLTLTAAEALPLIQRETLNLRGFVVTGSSNYFLMFMSHIDKLFRSVERSEPLQIASLRVCEGIKSDATRSTSHFPSFAQLNDCFMRFENSTAPVQFSCTNFGPITVRHINMRN